jgi:hypothetical protein
LCASKLQQQQQQARHLVVVASVQPDTEEARSPLDAPQVRVQTSSARLHLLTKATLDHQVHHCCSCCSCFPLSSGLYSSTHIIVCMATPCVRLALDTRA